ncbi:Hint domain-containing protein [Rhodobacteraceae bacterium 2376]|uniref:Hint domain-containing protein n=1 Tax=Rhabdonatronobacter sediminivivens TaxID=2743469 RepID=A0A7Z0HWL6_9RHOB|nr:Hint domain-containing protein [Rhabdonatronobacter sediminivivens]NYS23485.1 Hint domain-containing protein [Rhabdonatronobacter sediminivivens]
MPVQSISLPRPLPAEAPCAKAGRRTGFAPGTLVRTLAGDRPIDSLLAGDTLIDATGRITVLRGRQMQRLARAELVRIAPGALDPAARLDRDLLVGAQQEILHEDWRTRLLADGPAAVAAWRLVDDALITRESRRDAVLWSLVLDRPAVLRVNGLRVAVATTQATSGASPAPRQMAA